MRQVDAGKAIIVRNNTLLVLRESAEHKTNAKSGLQQFPGGRIEPGDPFLDGLKREVREDAGMEVSTARPFYFGESFSVMLAEQIHIVGIFFVCNSNGSDVVMSDEHDDYRWISPQSQSSVPCMTPDDQVVEEFFASHEYRRLTQQ